MVLEKQLGQLRSSELLQILAERDGDGGSLIDQLGAPHTNIKLRTITVKTSDGEVVAIFDGRGGGLILDEFIRASLVYEAVPLDEQFRRVYN